MCLTRLPVTALSRGMAQLEFDGLARRELSLTMDDCRLPSNVAKNRYRDISPCECLSETEDGEGRGERGITGAGGVFAWIRTRGVMKHY